MIKRLNHIALIVSSEISVDFYKQLGFSEERRVDRGYDQIVWLCGFGETLEIFIDGTHPKRVDKPEALGLRHLAFEVDDIDSAWEQLKQFNPEPIKNFEKNIRGFFIKDPDGLPIEIRS